MIPKIIHYTWFSNDPYPQMIQDCMDSWKEQLPDYEFVHWDMEKIKEIDNVFLKEALQNKKWAFAADYVRLYALYNFGGIYLDTDVLVYKSFDDLLNNKAFIGRENSYHLDGRRAVRYLTSHCMGGEKGHPFFKACLEYYKGRHFIQSEVDWLPSQFRFNQTILPYIQYEIAKLQGYDPSDRIRGKEVLPNGLVVFPSTYFDCFYPSKASYCKHLAMGGWRDKKNSNNKINVDVRKRINIGVHKLFETFHFSLFKNK